jgi:cytochrome c oxidase subunit IV
MAHPHAHQSFREEERVRHIGVKRYWVVWALLLVLTAVTLLTAKAIHLPSPWGIIVALIIATGKAALVALFFMHLWDHGGANRLVLVTALLFLALLMGLTVLDNATRFQLTNPPNERNMRAMPPGPDILSPMVEPRGSLAPERPSGREGTANPVRPTGSD